MSRWQTVLLLAPSVILLVIVLVLVTAEEPVAPRPAATPVSDNFVVVSKHRMTKPTIVVDADGQRRLGTTRGYMVTVRLFDRDRTFEVTQACYQTRRGDVLPRHCR